MSDVRSQDLWGRVERRFHFRDDIEENAKNLHCARELVSRLAVREGASSLSRLDRSGSVIFNEVSYSEIVDFIDDVSFPEQSVGSKVLISHLRKMERQNLPRPKVVLFSQSLGSSVWASKLTSKEKRFADAQYSLIDQADEGGPIRVSLPKRAMIASNGVYSVKSTHLGNSDDEKLFLSDEARDAIKAAVELRPTSADYLWSDERDFAGLLLYHFAVGVKDADSDQYSLGHGLSPTLGYTVSFPRPENLRGLSKQELKMLVRGTKHSYSVNKIHAEMAELGAYEEEEFEDDE